MKIAWILSALIAGAAHGQELELKGVKPGDPMDACPAGARQIASKTAETLCGLGPTTLANQNATDHLVSFHDGKVTAVMYQLSERGRHANSLVLNAFKAKYGDATTAKPHVNEYIWIRGNVLLSLDGFTGTVMLLDRQLMNQARDVSAKKSQGDI